MPTGILYHPQLSRPSVAHRLSRRPPGDLFRFIASGPAAPTMHVSLAASAQEVQTLQPLATDGFAPVLRCCINDLLKLAQNLCGTCAVFPCAAKLLQQSRAPCPYITCIQSKVHLRTQNLEWTARPGKASEQAKLATPISSRSPDTYPSLPKSSKAHSARRRYRRFTPAVWRQFAAK